MRRRVGLPWGAWLGRRGDLDVGEDIGGILSAEVVVWRVVESWVYGW